MAEISFTGLTLCKRNRIFINFFNKCLTNQRVWAIFYLPVSKMEEIVSTKQKILLEAEKLFAAKGYTSTSMDEIAKACSITKAAIYYHFSSKKQVIDTLMEIFTKKAINIQIMQNNVLKNALSNKNMSLNAVVKEIFLQLIDFLEQNQRIISIFFDYSLKDENNPVLFTFMDEYLISGMKMSPDDCCNNEEINEKHLKVQEFFMKYIPIMNYIIFQKRFCKYIHIDQKEAKEVFMNHFLTYLKNVEGIG